MDSPRWGNGMRSTGRLCRLFLLLAVVLSGCGQGMAKRNQESRTASALFAQFETVFYSKADLVSGSDGHGQLSAQNVRLLGAPFAYLRGGLDSLGKSTAPEILGSSQAVFVGAKDFRPPQGLGGVQSKFCYVILGRGSIPDLRKYFSTTPVSYTAGAPVWKWFAPPQEGHAKRYSFFMGQVQSSFILISNDLEELQTVANRLTSSDEDTGITHIPEWELLSQHDYWGYRQYRHGDAVDREAAGLSDVTPSAKALMFLVDFQKKEGVLRLLASDKSTADKLNSAMRNSRVTLPPLEASNVGAWETVIPLADNERTIERMFIVMGFFGFGVYL